MQQKVNSKVAARTMSNVNKIIDTNDNHVDKLQALNTGMCSLLPNASLCFLCSVNADADQVQQYLSMYPEALLLEGVCLLPEDSAQFIVQQHMSRCTCSTICRRNRDRIVQSLCEQGFEYYHKRCQKQKRQTTTTTTTTTGKNMFSNSSKAYSSKYSASRNGIGADSLDTDESSAPDSNAIFLSGSFLNKLARLENEIREYRCKEMAMRTSILEAAIEVRTFQEELDHQLAVVANEPSLPSHRASRGNGGLSRLACYHGTRPGDDRHEEEEEQERNRLTSALEYQMGVASVNLRSLEREHMMMLDSIRQGRRSEFLLLKDAFRKVVRYGICNQITPAKTT